MLSKELDLIVERAILISRADSLKERARRPILLYGCSEAGEPLFATGPALVYQNERLWEAIEKQITNSYSDAKVKIVKSNLDDITDEYQYRKRLLSDFGTRTIHKLENSGVRLPRLIMEVNITDEDELIEVVKEAELRNREKDYGIQLVINYTNTKDSIPESIKQNFILTSNFKTDSLIVDEERTYPDHEYLEIGIDCQNDIVYLDLNDSNRFCIIVRSSIGLLKYESLFKTIRLYSEEAPNFFYYVKPGERLNHIPEAKVIIFEEIQSAERSTLLSLCDNGKYIVLGADSYMQGIDVFHSKYRKEVKSKITSTWETVRADGIPVKRTLGSRRLCLECDNRQLIFSIRSLQKTSSDKIFFGNKSAANSIKEFLASKQDHLVIGYKSTSCYTNLVYVGDLVSDFIESYDMLFKDNKVILLVSYKDLTEDEYTKLCFSSDKLASFNFAVAVTDVE